MQTTRRTVLGAAASIALVGLAPKSGRAQTGTFNQKVGSNVANSHPIYIRLKEASDKIKAETDGKVNIGVFPNGQLGSDTDMLSQVRSGGMDYFSAPGVVLANLVPLASLNSVGFAFSDYPQVWKALDGGVGDVIRGAIKKAGLDVLDKVWDNGFRHITSNKLISSPADLTNMKIRVPVAPILLAIFKSLGASPTPINFNELYSALQTKVVEGQENPLALINNSKLYEVQKNCALTGHVWDGYWFLANKRTFDGMPANLRDIVTKHMNEAAVLQRADNEKLNTDLQKDLAAKGMAFNKPATDVFRKALSAAGFYTEWKGKFGDEAWAALEASVGKLA
jgi:tripartite ATP-independent transporter DctP family solute receptor